MPFYLTALLPNNKLLLLIFPFLACLAMYATLPKNTTGIKRPNALKITPKIKIVFIKHRSIKQIS